MLNVKPFLPYFKHLKPVKLQFALAIVAGTIYGMSSGLGIPFFAQKIFPMLFEDGNKKNVPGWLLNFVETHLGGADTALLISVSLALPLLMILRGASSYVNAYYMSYCGMHVVQAIQKSVFRKIQFLPLNYFNEYPLGVTVATVVDMPNTIKSVVVDTSNNLIKQPFTLLGAIFYLISLAFSREGARMALLGAVNIPLCVFPIRRVGKYIIEKTKSVIGIEGGINDAVMQTAISPMEIRAYNLQEREIREFDQRLNTLLTLALKKARIMLSLTPGIEVISAIGLSISLYMGVSHGMQYEEFMGVFLALFMSYEPIKKLGGINSTIAEAQIPLEHITKVLNMKDQVPEHPEAITLEHPVKGNVEFRNVSFSYQSNHQLVLKNINVKIAAGEIVALVGHSGAGKTSFANLIPRFYDTVAGQVCLDGIDIKEIRKSDLRNQIALVPQMPMLFNESIIENIRLGRLDATYEEVIEAAKVAYAHEFIMEQAHGYQTKIKERGMSLSGGQRQRISIARAVLKNAPIIILDEATSALDNDSEHMVQEALKKLVKGRTVIMIAHRFSSLKAATKTLYFKEGNLAAIGTHEELLETSPSYKELYLKQIHSYSDR